CRRQQPREHPQQRGLAGAIGPDDRRQLAGASGKLEAVQHRPGPETYMQVVRLEPHGASSARVLSTSHTKNGAPIRAVSTPILSSTHGCTRRSATSATSSMAAPPSM